MSTIQLLKFPCRFFREEVRIPVEACYIVGSFGSAGVPALERLAPIALHADRAGSRPIRVPVSDGVWSSWSDWLTANGCGTLVFCLVAVGICLILTSTCVSITCFNEMKGKHVCHDNR